jgi:hypothetical protein
MLFASGLDRIYRFVAKLDPGNFFTMKKPKNFLSLLSLLLEFCFAKLHAWLGRYGAEPRREGSGKPA